MLVVLEDSDPGAPVCVINKLQRFRCTARVKQQCAIKQKILGIEASSIISSGEGPFLVLRL